MKPKIVILGEKPQATYWLEMVVKSNLFNVIFGVPRKNNKGGWWGNDTFALTLKKHKIPLGTLSDLDNINFDILWSFLYSRIIPEKILNKAKLCLNLHEAPLPKYRGCNGCSFAILDQARTYGTTLHIMDHELDHGDIIDKILFNSDPNETAKELYLRTITYSNQLLAKNLNTIASGTFQTRENSCEQEPIRPRNALEEYKQLNINTINTIPDLYRFTRALDFLPFEPAFYHYENTKIYSFIFDSYDRKIDLHQSSINIDYIDTQVLKNVLQKGSIQINTNKRPIVLMIESLYKDLFPVY